MRTIRRDLLTLLISFFIFSGCKNTNEVGLEVDASKQVELRNIDTVSVRTFTVREDTAVTNGISQHLFGYLQDPDLGTTECNLAMSLSMRTADIAFSATSVLDSAVLVLKYGSEFYGDSVSSTYRIDVRELGEVYDLTRPYYNNKSWSTGALAGGVTVPKFNITKRVAVKLIRKGRADTIVTRGPQMRIPLNATYIKDKFINAPTGTFATAITFASYYKGIYLTQNKAQSTGRGGLVAFNLSPADSSQVEIYYRNISGTTIDTLVANFGISSNGTAANIVHQYTPAVQAQLNSPTQQFSTVFVQPMAGLRTRVIFPFINQLRSLGNIEINKAELVVQSIDSSLDPAPRLTLYRTDIAGQRQPVPDNNVGQRSGTPADSRALGDFDFGGFYDKTKKRYVFTITSYVQDILLGKLTQYNTYLSPLFRNNIRGASTDISPIANTAARSILGGGNNSQYKMKLSITYTKIK